jgi:hypothetical protein
MKLLLKIFLFLPVLCCGQGKNLTLLNLKEAQQIYITKKNQIILNYNCSRYHDSINNRLLFFNKDLTYIAKGELYGYVIDDKNDSIIVHDNNYPNDTLFQQISKNLILLNVPISTKSTQPNTNATINFLIDSIDVNLEHKMVTFYCRRLNYNRNMYYSLWNSKDALKMADRAFKVKDTICIELNKLGFSNDYLKEFAEINPNGFSWRNLPNQIINKYFACTRYDDTLKIIIGIHMFPKTEHVRQMFYNQLWKQLQNSSLKSKKALPVHSNFLTDSINQKGNGVPKTNQGIKTGIWIHSK